MSTTNGYGVVNVSHVAMFTNFGGTCVSDHLTLEPSAGYGGLNHHDGDGYGGPDIGHLVKLNMEARLAERRGQLPEVIDGLPKYLKAKYPLPISVVSSDGVTDVSRILVISTINGGCENISSGSAAGCSSLDHHDGNGDPDCLSQES